MKTIRTEDCPTPRLANTRTAANHFAAIASAVLVLSAVISLMASIPVYKPAVAPPLLECFILPSESETMLFGPTIVKERADSKGPPPMFRKFPAMFHVFPIHFVPSWLDENKRRNFIEPGLIETMTWKTGHVPAVYR